MRGVALLVGAALAASCAPATPPVTVGSKAFTEAIVLGEIVRQRLAEAGLPTTHRRQLGGTQVLWNALVSGEIDLYVEYTGTLAAEVLGDASATAVASLRRAVAGSGVSISDPIGFANTYALGMASLRADALGISTITDLANHPELRLGFSNEFMDRADGWPALRARYGITTSANGLDHDLAYRALAAGEIDVTDLYSTDAEIRYYDLRVLADDRALFPDYRAVFLYRTELASDPTVVRVLQDLVGSIDADSMIAMNAAVKLEGRSETEVAGSFLRRAFDQAPREEEATRVERLRQRGAEHLALVAISLGAAILVAVPAGVLAVRRRHVGTVLLGFAGVLQTIPSIALLVILIPVLGIGAPPAVLALFLYSLLPIMRNTASGLSTIPVGILESADALGLPRRARLRLVELPLATPAILAGVKTAAVINVGTATLGALIGAGGFGQPILTGIRLDDTALILEGAIPAAGLALIAQGGFALVERHLVPRGLRR